MSTQLSNITVKKADGTTDIVWSGLVPSSGDKNPAIWKSLTAGTSNAVRPEFRLRTEPNQTGSVRRCKLSFVYPITGIDSSGRTVVTDRIPFEGTFTVPQNVPDSLITEAVAQAFGLLNDPLVKQSIVQGYAPT